MCLCVCVCSLLRHRFNVFLPPLPKVVCPKNLDIKNPWGKSNGKKWSQIGKLLLIKGVKLPRKKCLFLGEFCLTEQDLLIGPDTKFIGTGSVLANRAGHCIY